MDATTFTQGPLAAGSYSFKAHYGGGNYNAAGNSDCEPLTVNKATPSITTELHSGATDGATPSVIAVGSSIDLNSSVHDSATVTNGGFAFTGTATFEFFKNKTCTGTPDDSATLVALVSGVADPALAKSNLASGNYAFNAKYIAGSDTHHNDSAGSSCESVRRQSRPRRPSSTTLKNAADDATIPNSTALALGTSVYDTSALSDLVTGISPNGTATVTYSFFKNNDCTGHGVHHREHDRGRRRPRAGLLGHRGPWPRAPTPSRPPTAATPTTTRPPRSASRSP